jgi:hypothetical protein
MMMHIHHGTGTFVLLKLGTILKPYSYKSKNCRRISSKQMRSLRNNRIFDAQQAHSILAPFDSSFERVGRKNRYLQNVGAIVRPTKTGSEVEKGSDNCCYVSVKNMKLY